MTGWKKGFLLRDGNITSHTSSNKIADAKSDEQSTKQQPTDHTTLQQNSSNDKAVNHDEIPQLVDTDDDEVEDLPPLVENHKTSDSDDLPDLEEDSSENSSVPPLVDSDDDSIPSLTEESSSDEEEDLDQESDTSHTSEDVSDDDDTSDFFESIGTFDGREEEQNEEFIQYVDNLDQSERRDITKRIVEANQSIVFKPPAEMDEPPDPEIPSLQSKQVVSHKNLFILVLLFILLKMQQNTNFT